MSIVPKNDENIKKCFCDKLKCPSYNDCAKSKGEKLYCSGDVSKSTCSFQANGCSCSNCPVHYDYSLTALYYCTQGPVEAIG